MNKLLILFVSIAYESGARELLHTGLLFIFYGNSKKDSASLLALHSLCIRTIYEYFTSRGTFALAHRRASTGLQVNAVVAEKSSWHGGLGQEKGEEKKKKKKKKLVWGRPAPNIMAIDDRRKRETRRISLDLAPRRSVCFASGSNEARFQSWHAPRTRPNVWHLMSCSLEGEGSADNRVGSSLAFILNP